MTQPRNSPPPLREANPGIGIEGTIHLTDGKRNWSESVNALDLLARAFGQKGLAVARHATWLEHPETGLVLLPQIAGLSLMDGGGFHTTTTIQVHHPSLTPEGVFEYQHSWGDGAEPAVLRGFEQWLEVDFVAFQDALRPGPATCMTLEMSFPAKDGAPAYHRRAVLGPVAHFVAEPQPPAPQPGGRVEEHPFCPCCLLTNSASAFLTQLQDRGFHALRLFAARGADGTPQADCRVNGEDYEPGAEALRAYVQTWPGTGYEFRKQYVLLQTIGRPTAAGAEAR